MFNYYSIMELDSLDRHILSVLMDDSRLSYRQIAKKVGVSTATVMNRIKALEKEIIKRYTVILDYEKLGYDVEVIIEVQISKGKMLQVEKEISNHPNVFAVYDTTGQFDASILARFPNRRKLDAFIKKLQTYDFVERTNTKIILNTIREKQVGV